MICYLFSFSLGNKWRKPHLLQFCPFKYLLSKLIIILKGNLVGHSANFFHASPLCYIHNKLTVFSDNEQSNSSLQPSHFYSLYYEPSRQRQTDHHTAAHQKGRSSVARSQSQQYKYRPQTLQPSTNPLHHHHVSPTSGSGRQPAHKTTVSVDVNPCIQQNNEQERRSPDGK